jgi:UDP-N-acetylmuramoyl-L-alanyl-D-glutamate--2,6-diaminopimelate ligase
MQSEQVLQGVECVRRAGPGVEVTGVEYDSRRVERGSLFVAMRGGTSDGNQYIAGSIERGAVAVVTDSAAAYDRAIARFPGVAVAEVAHGRRALSALAANYFEHPEKKLKLSGVTGTNGKTTTAFLLDAMLNASGRKTVLVGTIEYHVAGDVVASPHTTPESRDLLELFARGAALGATEAVMEVSSHALDQGRVYGLPFDTAMFTNLTQDHLDYHETMEKYFAAKCALFDGSLGQPPRVAVINIEDEYGASLALTAREHGAQVFSYGIDIGEFRAENVAMSPTGMSFRMHTPFGAVEMASRLTGRVNVLNLLTAAAAAMARGLSPEEVAIGARSLTHVPGRFQTVDAGQDFTVVIDYAHTDDALRNLLSVAREFVAPEGGRVITLFGCGGDRDHSKRPLMGRAAGELSDFVVLTSDNPRGEDPAAIVAGVTPALEATGVGYTTEVDRAAGIRAALSKARAGDIVLIAGKGHEKTQTIGGKVLPFDDAAVARAVLEEVRA